MKTKYLFSFIAIISFIIIASVVSSGEVLAQDTTEAADIQYPVKELGNCKDEAACKSYCDKPGNAKACVDFAEENNLMSKEEIELAKKFLAAGGVGPGGCRGKDECEEYCNDVAHIDECISFAEENNLIPPDELEEAKKVQAAIRRGVLPPPCGNKKACDIYCDKPENMEECIAFAEAAGFLQGKELEDAQKMLQAVKRGVTPPPCRGKDGCDKYCSDPANMEVCMNFAMEAGFMSEQEKAEAQKMLQAIKKGVKPPNCRGREECDVYCSTEEHFEECANFAEAAGFMSAEEAAMARKTKGKGPGGCKNKDECEVFCNNPDNQETCFNFAKEHDLIPEEDLRQMEEGKQRFKESLEQAPPEVLNCLSSLVGVENMEKYKSGAALPSEEIGDQMRQCFEKAMGPMGPGGPEGGPGMMSGQTGPGGCKTPEECQSYCSSHPEECRNFQPPSMPIGPEGYPPTGPAGCQTPEECQQMQEQMMVPPPVCPPEGCPQGPPPAPPEGQQPPLENVSPPPAEAPPPPESSLIVPNALLGSLLDLFLSIFQPPKR